jgi:hypothetical protein
MTKGIKSWEKDFDKEWSGRLVAYNTKMYTGICLEEYEKLKLFINQTINKAEEKAFNKGMDAILLGHLKEIKQKAVKEAKKEILTKAIAIFDKQKDDVMTGNVVNLELKNLRGDYGN